MKKTLKKSLALLLAVVMLFGASPILGVDFSTPASAADESDLYFDFISNDTEIEITGCNWTAAGDLIIPATYDGKPVTSIGDGAFYNCTELISVTLPESITSIGERAFQDCEGFANIVIPKSVTSIGEYAFYSCGNLKSVTFAEGSELESIGYGAFENCGILASITIPESVTIIDEYVFWNCSNLESVTFAEGSELESIGNDAFYYCSSLESITIPKGVTSIGDYAFSSCVNLKSVTFAEGSELESIGKEAFYYGDSLVSITIPASVTSIGDNAFDSCDDLESITFEEGSNLESIGKEAFEYCESLESITIPEGVTSIGDYAFYDCLSLSEIIVANGNANYSSADGVLFSKDGKILICYPAGKADESYAVPAGATSISSYAFYDCSSLASITIPASVTSIGYDAFSGTEYYDNPDNWTDNVLYISDCLIEVDSDCTSCNVAAGTRLIADAAFYYATELEEISVPESNANFSSLNGVLFSKDKDLLVAYPMAKAGVSYDIPGGVETIAAYAFYSCGNLESVTIPASVTSMGEVAFCECDTLVSVTFAQGSNLESIGEETFEYCYDLESVIIPASVASIGKDAFYSCESLASVTFAQGSNLESIGEGAFEDCESLESIDIPEGVTSIGRDAFEDCENLASVTIPESMRYIGEDAFEDCDNISDIYYGGTESDWGNVYLGPDSTEIFDAQWHYSIVVTNVMLDITSKTLFAGATQQLTATVAPEDATNKDVAWKSSDTAIATVSPTGLVTAVAPGTATITVTTRNKSETATCAITVISTTVSINNNSGTKTINFGDELKLTATANNAPDGAVIVWYVDGTEKGRGAEFTAPAAAADYTVTVKLVDGNNIVLTDTEENEIADEENVTVKAGFFQKLINFFKNLFGASRIVTQAFKQF